MSKINEQSFHLKRLKKKKEKESKPNVNRKKE